MPVFKPLFTAKGDLGGWPNIWSKLNVEKHSTFYWWPPAASRKRAARSVEEDFEDLSFADEHRPLIVELLVDNDSSGKQRRTIYGEHILCITAAKIYDRVI
jgi:hypothetical protein